MFSTLRGKVALTIALLLTAALGIPQVFADPGDAPVKGDPDDFVVTWSAADGGATTAAAPNAADLEFVAFDAGCRFFDTRGAKGPFTAGEFRDLSVRDGEITVAKQGVNGPCGVPNHAVAVETSLGTLGGSPTNSGFVKVGVGGKAPTATVLQYLKAQGTSVGATIPLETDGTLRIHNFGATTGLTGFLLGYWQTVLHAEVLADGTIRHKSPGVLSVSKSVTFAGDYIVTFDRPVDQCSGTVTAITEDAGNGDTAQRLNLAPNETSAVLATEMFVDARAIASNDEVDGGFDLIVSCGGVAVATP